MEFSIEVNLYWDFFIPAGGDNTQRWVVGDLFLGRRLFWQGDAVCPRHS